MGHPISYGISGASFSNPSALKSFGFNHFVQVVHAGATGNTDFVNMCRSQNVTPVLNNGNDGISSCADGRDCNAYYRQIAGMGYWSAGGESETPSEMSAIMNNLVFYNMGGEYGDCGNNFSNIWAHGAPQPHGKGVVSVLETYIGVSRVALCKPETVTALVASKQAGSFMCGLLIGVWGGGHGWGFNDYAWIINEAEARGVRIDIICLWLGHGSDANSNLAANANNNLFKQFMGTWPAETAPLHQVSGGGGVEPTKPFARTPKFYSVLVNEILD